MAVDINYTSAEDLSAATGIELGLAKSIIEYRDERGSFTSLDTVAGLPGCDEMLVMRMRGAGVNLGASEAQGSSSE
jgi:DNA uptake protein ComE-like DNA-binding protein